MWYKRNQVETKNPSEISALTERMLTKLNQTCSHFMWQGQLQDFNFAPLYLFISEIKKGHEGSLTVCASLLDNDKAKPPLR